MLLKLYTDETFDFYYSARKSESSYSIWQVALDIDQMCNPSKPGAQKCACPKQGAMEEITQSVTQQRDVTKKIRAGVLSQLANDIQIKEKKGKKKVTLAEYARLFRLQRLVDVFEDSTKLVLQLRGWYEKNREDLSEEQDSSIRNGIQKISQGTKVMVQIFTESSTTEGLLMSQRIGKPLEKKIAKFQSSFEGLLVVLHNLAIFIEENKLLQQHPDSPHVELPDISLLEIRLPQKYIFTERISIRVTEMAH